MTELARTRFTEGELDATPEERLSSNPLRPAIKNTDVTEWPKDESYDREHRSSLWLRDSSLDTFHGPARQMKANLPAKTLPAAATAVLDRQPAKPVKIAIKTKGRILLINPADILSVEAEGNYVLLRRRSDFYSLREAISSLAEKLKDYGFVRIHRSVLVNATWVDEIFPGPTGEYILRMAGGKEYMVSRTYKTNLKWLAQSWIGTDSFVDE
jgi:hypothetical protein